MKPRDLSLLVMHVSTRCDQTCAHCSIWRHGGKAGRELDPAARETIIREAHSLGARTILFTGGEPLLCDHIERLARVSRDLGLSVQIATNGLGLARAAAWLVDVADEIYVSLDGPEAVHDELRGPGMYARLVAGVGVIAAMPVRPRLVARSVVSRRNARALEQTVAAARLAGFDSISFLAVDTTSDAFGGETGGRAVHALAGPEIQALREGIERLARTGALGAYVVEDERKMLEMARHLGEAASAGGARRGAMPPNGRRSSRRTARSVPVSSSPGLPPRRPPDFGTCGRARRIGRACEFWAAETGSVLHACVPNTWPPGRRRLRRGWARCWAVCCRDRLDVR